MKLSIKRDSNGNKVLFVKPDQSRGFSIQTLGNLIETHEKGVCDSTLPELKVYISEYGTEKQKQKINLNMTRTEYMTNGSKFHNYYYSQFITNATFEFIKNNIGLDKLKKSKDPLLNDVVKMRSCGWIWDNTPVNITLARKLGECSGFGSKAFHTCVGKAAAKKLLKEA